MALNFLERLFPGWFLKRKQQKNMLEEYKRNYDAAKKDRFRENWTPVNASAEQTDGPFRNTLRARARSLERNSDSAQSVIGALLRNVVGTGIKPQARVKKNDGSYYEEVNDKLEKEFKKWKKHKNCDISGQQTFYEIQEMILRRRIVDGEILIRKVTKSNSKYPLKLQAIEADMLDNASHYNKNETDNYIVGGIEVNDYYKPLAYYLYNQSPDGFSGFNSKKIDAEEIIHLFKKTRPTQVRGISELAPVMDLIKDTGDYMEAELIAARIAASFAAFVTKTGGNTRVGRTETNEDDNKIEKIYPGMIEYLQPGEDIQVADPGRDSEGVSDYMKVQDRRISSGMGLSYEVVSRDMSETNYSSARQNLLEDRRTWIPVQNYMINHFCQPIWEDFVRHCALTDKVNLPGFWSNPDKYYRCEWIAPGWTWIDPEKDVKASKEEVKAGLKNISEIAAEQGRDWKEVLKQAAREKDFAEEIGLNLDVFGGVENNQS